jgi:putative colanic acid biosynthesis acetyltransferase WcaF
MQVRLDKFNNYWYKPASRLKIALWMLCSICFIQSSLPWPMAFKRSLLRLFGAKLGKGVVIKPTVHIKYPWKLKVANHVWIGEKVWIDNLDEVILENHVCLSQGSMLLCGNHDYKKETFDLMTAPITLKEGVWIGAQATVCPGVKAAKNSILSVGSVATKDLEEGMIYQGVPAIIKRARHEA